MFLWLTRFKEEDRNLSKIEINEMLRLVCNIRSKIAADDAMPGGVVLLVEFLLDVGRNILFAYWVFYSLPSKDMVTSQTDETGDANLFNIVLL